MLNRWLMLLWSLGVAGTMGSGGERGAGPKVGGTLRIALDGQIGTVNPCALRELMVLCWTKQARRWIPR
jgi:hypothetical protein